MQRSVMIGDARIAYEERGAGPTVLLVHGFPFDRSMWARQVVALSGRRRIAPDLRGLGASGLGRGRVTMARYADDLVGLLDALGIQRAVVCGLSMGGYVSFELLRRHPERVRGLVLMDTRANADSSEARRGRDEMAALVNAGGMRPVAKRLVPKLLAARTARSRPRAVQHLRRMIVQAPPAGVVAALGAMRDRPDATGLLEGIRVPTLVLAGAEDQLTPPEVAKALAAQIRGSQCVIVPGAGHVPPIERPHIVARVLRQFFERVG